MSLLEATRKYQGKQDVDLHGGPVVWPGVFGHPIKGASAPQLLKREEIEDRAELVQDFHCHAFRTWDADDMAYYQKLMDYIYSGHGRVVTRSQPEYDPEHGGWRFWLEWTLIYGHIAPMRRPGLDDY